MSVPISPSSHAGDFVRGADLSKYQGQKVNWREQVRGGYSFAILKSDEGASVTDSSFASFADGAAAEGVPFLIQHFCRPRPGAGDAVKEARHCAATIASRLKYVRAIALDVEEEDAQVVGPGLAQWILDCAQEITRLTGKRVGLYTNDSYMHRTGCTLNARHLALFIWVAQWGVTDPSLPKPQPHDSWTFHQDGIADIPGVSGMADHNWFHGTAAQCSTWFQTVDPGNTDPCAPENSDVAGAGALCEPPDGA